MKRIILLLLSSILIAACSQDKSVVDKLNSEDVNELVEQDSLYSQIIMEADQKRKMIEDNIVLVSKYKDLTFEDYYNYKSTFLDTNIIKNISDSARSIFRKEMDTILAKYKPKVDSQMNAYKDEYQKMDPSKYFRVEFSSISKDYYTYSDEVEDVNIKFKIIPLKGSIQGGSFRYGVISKVTDSKVADGGCRFSTTTTKPSVYTWKAPYDVEDEFEYKNTNNVKNKYDFDFNILTVRSNNKTIKSLDKFDIPIVFKAFFKKDSLTIYEYEVILEQHYDVEVKSYSNIYNKLLNEKKKKTNKLAYQFENISLDSK